MRYATLSLLVVSLAVAGCRTTHYVFRDAPPVTRFGDQEPSPVPRSSSFQFGRYAVLATTRDPLLTTLDVRRTPRSGDVNAMDQVVSSAWYTPRLGAQHITGHTLLDGPVDQGAPVRPVRIVKAKMVGDTPGFIIEDRRGLQYLIKFDSPEFMHVQSTVNLVVSRLFWGFGYNVPEDFKVMFTREELRVEPNGGVDDSIIDEVLQRARADTSGRYHATASRLLEGTVLGPVSQFGTRRDDANDTIPHQHLRILRALHVFCAFTDHSGMRSDNTLDVYVGEPGQGHTVHYLLDFGEALGVHGSEKDRAWDGFEHYFSWKDALHNAVQLGLQLKPWERLPATSGDPRGTFEVEAFDPPAWKETHQFAPMHHSLPDDDYWAAKIVGAVTREQLATLFRAAGHPDAEYTRYLMETLMGRRAEILQYYLAQVSPLESEGVRGEALEVTNMRNVLLPDIAGETTYTVQYYDDRGRRVAPSRTIRERGSTFRVPVAEALAQTPRQYLRVDVRSSHNGHEAPRAAAFHVRRTAGETPTLVGIVH